MRPKVICTNKLLYYPIRRAASSATQLALEPATHLPYTDISEDDKRIRFTLYRNTFHRLQSLYYTYVSPAPQGLVTFGLPQTSSFDEWILAVCATDDNSCDEHLHSQDWEYLVPSLRIHHYPERSSLPYRYQFHPLVPVGRSFQEEYKKLDFTQSSLDALARRYRAEITKWNYAP